MTQHQIEASIAYFKALKVPESWQYIGVCNFEYSAGLLYGINPDFRIRVCFVLSSERGGLCERHTEKTGKYKYDTVVSNKTIEALNKFIAENYE